MGTKIYTPSVWEDEILSGDERYDIASDGGTPIETNVRIDLATSVAQAGTAVDADKMNNIEEGLDALDTKVADMEVHAATGKTTPVDADEIGLMDSAASFVQKKLTWANLKATLKTYFDTLYVALTSVTTTPTASKTPISLANGYLDGWISTIPVGMRNGKIVVTNPSSDLVIAIKTLAGSDPSATDPVYIRINGVERTITAALSLTLADGTNWFNAGSSVGATKEMDYFVYFSWRTASSAVVLGLSRIPWATVYSDFSATSTNEKHGAFSTAPASTDDCVVVGRIAATLSAGAGYTWTSTSQSAPTSANTVQRPIFETRWLILAAPSFTVSTIDNGSGGQPPINEFRYRVSGRKIDAHISGNGVKAGAGAFFTFASADLPFAPSNLTGANAIGVAYNSDNIFPGVAVYFSTNLHCVFSASIADNQAFTNGWGANFGYEA